MSTPIFDALSQYAGRRPIRAHTPGHSGARSPLDALAPFLAYDATELEGLDSLYDADGCIRRSEQRAAAVFGAAQTIYAAGGCTLAIQTMLALTAGPGDRLLMGRNAHQSAIHAAALLGLQPVFVCPDAYGAVDADAVGACLDRHTHWAGVYLTSPSYLGARSDTHAIAQVCRRKGVPLLVDNAHGSHLAFLTENLHPLHAGADLVADSAHKTLPVLTGGAMLHLAKRYDVRLAKKTMAVFGSTSPSYLILASLDLCVDWLAREGAAAYRALEQRAGALREIAAQAGLAPAFERFDPVRLTIEPARLQINGRAAAAWLQTQNIFPEYADDRFVVLILTPFLSARAWHALAAALKALPRVAQAEASPIYSARCAQSADARSTGGGVSNLFCSPREIVLPLRDALFGPKERLSVEEAVGKTAAEAVNLCPPGIPIVLPGELIDEEAVKQMLHMGVTSVLVVARK